MLSHALDAFQTRMALRIHITQLSQGHEVNTVGPSTGPATSSMSITSALSITSTHISVVSSLSITSSPKSVLTELPEPSAPQIFFERDAELNQILDMIFESRPAHIAILGPGGCGKTTLASTVLAHHRVCQHFGDARYFVACESATSPADLSIELAKTLGLLEAGSDAPWSRIMASLAEKECIICLDNFESPWDQAAETRDSVEELLSEITSLPCVTALVTIRGTERPDRTHWTQPTLAPLRILDDHTAQVVAGQDNADSLDGPTEQPIAVAPITNPRSPFQTPLSRIIRYLMRKTTTRHYSNRASGGALENEERKRRDVRAIRWLIANDDETDSFLMAIPGTFTSDWGIEVWRRVSDEQCEDSNSRPNGLTVRSHTNADLRVTVLPSPHPQRTFRPRSLLRPFKRILRIRTDDDIIGQ
ncbi:hypothetical protein H4582DRAFT_1446814 [Lactarius indigo]|nr:hypothetical protein H4582DRAFT_1446814 [Lactarius indigo]